MRLTLEQSNSCFILVNHPLMVVSTLQFKPLSHKISLTVLSDRKFKGINNVDVLGHPAVDLPGLFPIRREEPSTLLPSFFGVPLTLFFSAGTI